jgi:F420 biosynthesis protein FbiB-like protein
MDPHGFLRSRRSIRRFKTEAVPRHTMERILTTATFAPSAHNRQPWRFAVVADLPTKNRLAVAMAEDFRRDLEGDGLPEDEVDSKIQNSRARITSAPIVVVLCMETSDMDHYPDALRAQAERLITVQSTANAGLTLLLAVHAENLGAVWSCAPLFAAGAVRRALSLPETWEPQAMFFIGHPLRTAESRGRRPLDEVSIFI